jgi:S-adenosyl-L-methionine hydrolase (adenosine-forming)
MHNKRIIGLLTDFGSRGSHYVASMKAVILKINPKVKFVDISHDINPFSIIEASYMLKATLKFFPEKSIIIVVIDPGVGSSREILGINLKSNKNIIGPNNGVFGMALGFKEISFCVNLNNKEYFLDPVSNTFHGRDIMAPLAAHLSLGKKLSDLGVNFPKENLLSLEKFENLPFYNEDRIKCYIQYIDNFGNAVTNIILDNFERILKIQDGEDLSIIFNEKKYDGKFTSYFGKFPIGSLLFLEGSTGFLEISINQGSAQKYIGFNTGDIITIIK